MESFAPKIRDPRTGQVYTPEGWQWIIGFAFAGCEWAIKEADKPEFREMVKKSLRERKIEGLQRVVDDRLDEIAELRAEMKSLRRKD